MRVAMRQITWKANRSIRRLGREVSEAWATMAWATMALIRRDSSLAPHRACTRLRGGAVALGRAENPPSSSGIPDSASLARFAETARPASAGLHLLLPGLSPKKHLPLQKCAGVLLADKRTPRYEDMDQRKYSTPPPLSHSCTMLAWGPCCSPTRKYHQDLARPSNRQPP